jgi:hypothetical protein
LFAIAELGDRIRRGVQQREEQAGGDLNIYGSALARGDSRGQQFGNQSLGRVLRISWAIRNRSVKHRLVYTAKIDDEIDEAYALSFERFPPARCWYFCEPHPEV